MPEAVRNLLALYSFECYWEDSIYRKGDWISVYRLGGDDEEGLGDFRIDDKPVEDLITEIRTFLDWLNGVI